MPENEAAYGIYQRCADQLIVGMAGPIAVNLLAVESALNIYGIDEEEKAETADKIIYISRKVLSQRSENGKK